jgi:hypothetical protein
VSAGSTVSVSLPGTLMRALRHDCCSAKVTMWLFVEPEITTTSGLVPEHLAQQLVLIDCMVTQVGKCLAAPPLRPVMESF